MFTMPPALGGKAGPGEAIGHSYASSWQIILATDVLPQEFVLFGAHQAAATWLQRPETVKGAGNIEQ